MTFFRAAAAMFALGVLIQVPDLARADVVRPVTRQDLSLLAKTVAGVAARYPMRTAQLGVAIVEARSGRRLLQWQAEHEFAPASNFKLLVGASALAYLGQGFQYRTTLLARGVVSKRVLEGDLLLVGGGDPVLSRTDLRQAAVAVKAAGIQKITGTVLVDGSIFDGQRYGAGWAWDDMPYYYQPPIQALAVDEGTVGVTVVAGAQPGAPASAALESDPGSMSLESDATTVAAHGLNDVDCFRSPGSMVIRIVGHLPLNEKSASFRCTVEDSDADGAAIFTQMLADKSITTGSAPRGPLPANVALDISDESPAPPPAVQRYPGATVLWEHASPTVADLLKRMMPPSDNFIAEHLFKMLPIAAFGRRGSFNGGAQVEQRFIASLGLPPQSIDNGDGSGLSQGDRITPLALAETLRWETRNPAGRVFMQALAKAGINGTVRRHLRGTDAVGRVLAKDGYIWHVSTFSGYAYTRHHGLMIFSVMFNDANGSLRPFLQAEDIIVRTLVDLP